MEPKNRSLLVVAIAITIVIGVLTSFGLPFFSQTPRIVLSDGETDPGISTGDPSYDPEGAFIPIAITRDTVQAAVASLERDSSHYRIITIERWGSGTGAVTTVQTWKHGRFERVALLFPDGTSQNRLMDGSTTYLWRSGERNYHAFPATQRQIDLGLELPTYELVAEMNPEYITDARYDLKDGQACIYVEYQVPSLDYIERCWVSAETGLLIASELLRASDEQLKYRMTQTSIDFNMDERMALDAALFTLPDGTKLD